MINQTELSRVLTDSDRYLYEPDGLRIYSIGLQDNGTYECRAEVTAQGNLKVKLVTLDV